MKKWYAVTMTKVVQMLDSDIKLGLTEEKIKYMRETYGENIILKPKIDSLLTLTINEMKQLWIVIYLAYIVMLFYNSLFILAYFITFIMIISVILLINVDYKEVKNIRAIDNLNTPFSYLKRSGKICKVSCEQMVVGDIVFLEKGNYVSADIRILECEDLKVREVAVTGENYEVEKYSMKLEGEIINLSEIKNIVFKSSVVTEGSGLGIVIATGMNTQIGEIIKVLLVHKDDNRVFSRKLKKIANRMSLVTITAGIITLVLSIYKKFSIHESINALIYILITFNLPIFVMILFLYFYIIFSIFKQKRIYIKNISTMYDLTNISTIFTKKIGAISENKFIFREVYCDNTLIDVQSQGFEMDDTIERTMSIALVCNDVVILCNEDTPRIGDFNSVEVLAEYAIIEFFKDKQIKKNELESKQDKIFDIPYNSDKRIKTVVIKIEDRYRANVLGILDSLLNKCTHILINGVEKEIKITDMEDIINVHIDMSNRAYYVIALGYRNFNYEPSIDENIESNLVFVGLMGFENPIKESSYGAMKICEEINIKPIIDEGGNKLTSFAAGKLIGLTQNKEEILSGIEIDYMSDEEFEKNIEGVSIFSKITPKHKSEIVKSLSNKGYSIASVGDTLTDLEYLNNSNISISVGNECSNLVRKLSSVFLQENDFSEIINLIQYSKKIINYISELVLFLSATIVSEIFIILVSLIIKSEMPFTFAGILYLNFIVVPCCGISILVQNRNIKQNLKKINYNYIKRVSIKNSFIISIMYFLILTVIDKYAIIHLQDISLVMFALYQNIFCLRLLNEKNFLKNKVSYTLVFFNLFLQSILILFL